MDTTSGKQGSLKKKIDEELLCSICQGRVNQPKTLTQCSHSFCQICLEKSHIYAQRSPMKRLQADELECPTCRTVTPLPEGQVANLPTIPALRNVADILSDMPEGDEQEHQETCKKHGNVLNQYCGVCNELLCSECIHDPKQKEHLQSGEITLVRIILPQSLESLSKQLESTRELESQAQGLTEEVERKRKTVLTNGEEAKAAITAFFGEVTKTVEERRKALISAVDRNMNGKLTTLDEHNQTLEVSKNSTRGITTRIHKLRQSREVHAVTDGKIIQGEVLQTRETFERLDGQLKDGSFDLLLKFQGDPTFEHYLGNLGMFTECETDPDSSYLTIKHQLSVNKDGNVFKGSPAATPPQTQYVPMMVPGQEAYIYSTQLGIPHSGSLPQNIAAGLIPPSTPRSPSDSTVANYAYAAPTLGEPQYSPRPGIHKPLLNMDSPNTTSPYENVTHLISKSPRALRSVEPAATTPQRIPKHLPPARKRSSSDSTGIYKRLETTEAIYDEVPREDDVNQKPVLPPRNVDQSARRQRSATLKLPFQLDTYKTERATFYVRLETELVEPVRVITSDQLCDARGDGKVFPCGVSGSSLYNIIAFTDVHHHCLRLVSKDDTLAMTIGSQGKANEQFDTPTSVLQTYNGIYIVDRANGRVQKLSKEGKVLKIFGRRHLQSPWGIAISKINGDIYVSDTKQQCIGVYRSDCNFARFIGGKHSKSFQFDQPAGMAFDTSGNLLVVDRGQVPCIWHISLQDGQAELLGKIGTHYLHDPCDVTVAEDSSIIVTERGSKNRVSVFSLQGEPIRCFGKTGSQPGEFRAPSGVTTNREGQIIVADQYNHRLQIFDLSKRDDSEGSDEETYQNTQS